MAEPAADCVCTSVPASALSIPIPRLELLLAPPSRAKMPAGRRVELSPRETDARSDGEDENDGSEQTESVYEQLLHLARRHMRGQAYDHTLQPTALVHEVWMRLAKGSDSWEDTSHFFAAAGSAMRSVLVDHARRRGAAKRTPPGARVTLDLAFEQFQERAIDLVALDEALNRLAEFDPTMADAVEHRFFGGLSVEMTAKRVGMSKRTFERRWLVTRRWLRGEIA